MKSRRSFLVYSGLALAAISLPGHASYSSTVQIIKEPFQTIATVYDDIFPPTPKIPGAMQLNTIGYLQGVLRDQWIDDETKTFIRNGVTWINETSNELYQADYIALDSEQRQKVREHILEYRWGESWVYHLMTYFFESMFGDPVYGANIDQRGWHWLEYSPGLPRPSKVML